VPYSGAGAVRLRLPPHADGERPREVSDLERPEEWERQSFYPRGV
jgi:hypothetical protein